tara:strand:+ start:5776 stop:5970 length:195 start_codon:yes stop_codon:yes gene_type:complete
MSEKMSLTRDERRELEDSKSEKEWYEICDKIKVKRSGQYPPHLSREILHLYQQKFPEKLIEEAN